MSTQSPLQVDEIDYPTGDGQPVAETEIHRDNLLETVWMLQQWYKDRDDVYVSGNMFVYYVQGNPRRHLAPDVFVVHGVPKHIRDCYKTWEEPRQSLDLVIEFTSKSTSSEDLGRKLELYRDFLGVREYLLFDPYCEYLDPPQVLYRLTDGDYEPVAPVDGRLPSEVLGLHFERDEMRLRLWSPASRSWLLFPREIADEYEEVQKVNKQVRQENEQVLQENRTLLSSVEQSNAENEQLRAELEALKRRLADGRSNGGE